MKPKTRGIENQVLYDEAARVDDGLLHRQGRRVASLRRH